MTKISGFRSQDVEVTRRASPDSDKVTTKIPPEWLPLMEKIARWFDNSIYPVWSPFGYRKTRSNKKRNQNKTYIPVLATLWNGLSAASKANWKTAADFVKKNGYQLFMKDTAYRKKNDLAYPRAPDTNFPMFGLKIQNWGGAGNVRLRRDDISLTGQVTVSFNYKKTERAPTGDAPFKFVAYAYYFKAGKNYYETHTWTAPAGNVAWASVSETFGTAGRRYFHVYVTFHLDSYDADVYLANFLIQDQSLSWTVDYQANELPEDATPAWTKTGDLSEIKQQRGMIFLREDADSANKVEWKRTPTFDNSVGSSVEVRLKIEEGTDKDSGNNNHVFEYVHCDGIRKIEVRFFTNGIILKLGSECHKYHYDTSRYRTYKSFIRLNRLYFYVGRTLAFRKELNTSGTQEVSFSHHGRDDHNTESQVSFVKYYQGRDAAPGEDIIREGWWIKSRKVWEPELLERKTGWTFTPGYYQPYFEVVYLG